MKKYGPWASVRAGLRNIRQVVVGASVSEAGAVGKLVTDAVHKEITIGPPPPLAPSTIERKMSEGRSAPTKTWYQSGWLSNQGLQTEVKMKGRNVLRIMVVPSTKIHPEAHVPANTLFKWMEFGTSTQPARPVFGPVKLSLEGKGLDKIKSILIERIRDHLEVTLK